MKQFLSVTTASNWFKGIKKGTVKLTAESIGGAANWLAGRVGSAAKWVGRTAVTAANWARKRYNTAKNWVTGGYSEGKKYFDTAKNFLTGSGVVTGSASGSLSSAPANGQSLAYRDYSKLSASSADASVSGDKEKKTQLLAS